MVENLIIISSTDFYIIY